jgi:hypothetical protein
MADSKSFLRAYFKIGDKECASGKEWASLRHGMIICWQRIDRTILTSKQCGGPPPGKIDKVAFAILEMDDTSANEKALREACAPVEAYDDKGEPDTTLWRARKGYIEPADIATKIGKSELDADWKEKDTSVEPQYVLNFDTTTDLKDSTKKDFLASPVVADKNAVAQGDYDVGTGGDYSTWANAYADIANLTGDLTFTQISDVTETAIASITEGLGGYTFTCTVGNNDWHYGNTARGYVIDVAHDTHMFFYQCEGPGATVSSQFRGVRTVSAANPTRSFIIVYNVSTSFDMRIEKILWDGGGLDGTGVAISDDTPSVYVYACQIWDCIGTGIDAIDMTNNNIVENNSIIESNRGINCRDQTGIYRRNACYDNDTADFDRTGIATGYANASSDATAADANWDTGDKNLTNQVAADDFLSTDDTNSSFLDIDANSDLAEAGVTTILSDHTTGIRGRARPTSNGTVSIGAAEIISGTPRSQYYGQYYGQYHGQY